MGEDWERLGEVWERVGDGCQMVGEDWERGGGELGEGRERVAFWHSCCPRTPLDFLTLCGNPPPPPPTPVPPTHQ